jgi:uncharacterized HAD superfamily protein
MKKKIGIDLDEVLANFHAAIMDYHNKVYGTFLKPEDFKTCLYNEVWGGTLQEAIQKVNDFYFSSYFSNISPISHSVSSVDILARENELFIVTSRPNFLKEETERWLNQFFQDKFSGVFYSSNHYTKRKNCGKSKWQICKELEVSVLIDDSLDYVTQCPSTGIRGILFGDYPWNQNGNLPKNVIRVRDWKEALEQLT